ncbi:MAG: LptE family protein [Saprospiraceae bacterium]|nr:LptE family protein [Saprospiraceae bacterium]
MNRLLFIVICAVISGCYFFFFFSFTTEIYTFFVEDFENRAPSAPGAIEQTFAEALRTKVRNESKLRLTDPNADIIFSGAINRFNITSEAPQEGNTIAFNRLTIGVNVEYKNSQNEDDSWTQSFSFFRDFDSNADFQSLQDEFVDEIFVQITEDIFNRAFTNW